MTAVKRTLRNCQSQWRKGGFLLLEALMACGLLAGIGVLFQQQRRQAAYLMIDAERRLQLLLTMNNAIERMHHESVFVLQLGYRENDTSCYWTVEPLYEEEGNLLSHCVLVRVIGLWNKIDGTEQKISLTTVILGMDLRS